MDYKFILDGIKLKEIDPEGNVEVHEKICDYLEDKFETVSTSEMHITAYTDAHSSPSDASKILKQIEDMICKKASQEFKDKDFTFKDLVKFDKKIEKIAKEIGIQIYESIHKTIENILNENSKKTGGMYMFKTLKEAKLFTAHLDALANEIQGLDDLSDEMRTHLAFRIDKLSDLIETSAHKKEATEKQANGVGHGAWKHDADEDAYMSTMGGTGALQHDADEDFMAEFKGEDNMAVLMRKEPADIKGAGPKAKQPSDGYNQKEVADKLKMAVKKAMEKGE
jgi:hypothetical protein